MGEWMDIIIDDQLPNKHAAKPQVSFYKSDRNGPLLMAIKIKKWIVSSPKVTWLYRRISRSNQVTISSQSDHESGDFEYWVPLVEKAYAKFFGGYKNIIGGDPTWALFNVTGGVTLEVLKLKSTLGFDLFEFLHRIQHEALFATSNTETEKGRRSSIKNEDVCVLGLVAGHAYAMLELASVTFV